MNVMLRPLVVLILLAAQADAQEYPRWTQLSSKTGDLPAPGKSQQQTGCLVLDIDKNGLNDIVITSRNAGSRMVWYQRSKAGWTIYPIDRGLDIEAGGASADIDGDGDLDLAFGEDHSGSKMFWWENPYPLYAADRPWVRREIKSTGGTMHHDQIFGEFGDDGRLQLAFWVQQAGTLFLANIPRNLKRTEPWGTLPIAKVGPAEGLAKADIDGDGKCDLIGGGYWFKYLERSRDTNRCDREGLALDAGAGRPDRRGRTTRSGLRRGGRHRTSQMVRMAPRRLGRSRPSDRKRGTWT